MTEVYKFSESQVLLFFCALVRMASFVVSWPVFGVENVSPHIKVLFALTLTMIVFPTLQFTPEQAAQLQSNLILIVLKEAFVGLALGFLARLFFFTFRIAGEMLSQAMGLSSAQVFNPMMGGQTTAIEQFYVTLASLFYLGVNGHHHLISGLINSFAWVPPATLGLNTSQFAGIGNLVQEVIELGLRFSAPVVISILVVNLILGVVGKTVPQLNVLVTSFPVNIGVGYFLIVVTMPMLFDQVGSFLQVSTSQIFAFVKTF